MSDLMQPTLGTANQYWSIVPITEIVEPARTVLIADKAWDGDAANALAASGPGLSVTGPYTATGNPGGAAANHGPNANPALNTNADNTYKGYATFLFCDCHVGVLPAWTGTAAFSPTALK
jgi:prepilin-type processing-associated H-X9-DG protein